MVQAKVDLRAVLRDGTVRGHAGPFPPDAETALRATAQYYGQVGFDEPWISYLALSRGAPVGICSFKPPKDGSVEIAYYTFAEHEGRGIATAMAARLVAMARERDGALAVTARTLPGRNASHRVLEKLGFDPLGTVEHPEDGTVVEWRLRRERATGMDERDTRRMFDDRAEVYAASRPRYPPELYAWIAGNCALRRRVWDVACGNGQASIDLAGHFVHVDATDVSAAQIAHAAPHPRVRYAVQPAEASGFPDACFDAVTVAQALHWLDLDRFWREVARVLRPGGLFAAWGYAWPRLDPSLDEILRVTLLAPIESYWSPRNRLMWNGYRDVGMPWKPLPVPVFHMTPEWDLDEFYAYAYSWSATQRCIDERGEGFLHDSRDRMRGAWGTARRRVPMSFHLIAATANEATPRDVTAADPREPTT